jgi:hypothetical protein
VTLALAVVGALTGLTSLALTATREWRDRPRLHISADPTTSPDGSGGLTFIIENRGRQPVTVGSVGLAWNVDGDLPPNEASGRIGVNNPWDRTLIPPGGSTQIYYTARTPIPVPAGFQASGEGQLRSTIVACDDLQLTEEVVSQEQDDDQRASGRPPAPSGAARGQREHSAQQGEHG